MSRNASEFLRGRAEEDFVHVDVFRLADREGEHAREAVGWDRVSLIELLLKDCVTETNHTS
jgi:hypothetical protein